MKGVGKSLNFTTGGEFEFAQTLFDANPQPMWIYDRRTLKFVAVNEAALQSYGYSREEFLNLSLEDLRPEAERERLRQSLSDDAAGFKVSQGWRHVDKHGDERFVDIHRLRIKFQGRDAALVAVHDVTAHHELQQDLIEQTAYFRQLFENSPDAIVILDGGDCIQDVNPSFSRLFGYSARDARGNRLNDLIVPGNLGIDAESLSAQAQDGAVVGYETVRKTKKGRRIHVEVMGYPILVNGRQRGIYGIYRDITERREMIEKIAFQARHDALTALVNRAEFETQAKQLLARARRDGSKHALLYMDLDQFKVINDTCGHAAGDELLRQLAQLMQKRLRATDTIARLGGDEFGLLLIDCSMEQAEAVAKEYVELVRRFRFHWRKQSFVVGVSIGAAAMDSRSNQLLDVLSAADAACYMAKERGRNRVHVHSESDAALRRQRVLMDWVTHIHRALDEGRFLLYYQRLASLCGDGGPSLCELFIRMVGEDGRIIMPASFIPAAERYNLMPMVDRWVIENAFMYIAARQARQPSRDEVFCLNLSGTSLSDDEFIGFVHKAFEKYGVSPHGISFEITETAAVSDLPRALRFISDVRELGCAIGVDDFGSGVSSFTYLKSMNIDYLKIDGDFIRGIAGNPVDLAMTQAINHVGQVMGIKTIAEFVESDATLEHLRDLGVDYAQGNAIHTPELLDMAGLEKGIIETEAPSRP